MSKAHHGKGRDYAAEYPAMNARRKSVKAVEKKLGHKLPKGMQVDHKNSNPLDTSQKNLQVISKKANLKKEQGADKKVKKTWG